jgi:hypothetical protein
MGTADGHWHVEVIRRGNNRRYRLRHDGTIVDGLTITGVEEILSAAGVDLSDLTPTDAAIPAESTPA